MATLNYTEEHGILANARDTGAYLLERLKELLELDIVGDVRGRGFMCGIELVKDKATKEPFPPARKASLLVMLEGIPRGLILFPCTGNVEGVMGDMLLVTPPLITTRSQVDEIVAITREALLAAQKQLLG